MSKTALALAALGLLAIGFALGQFALPPPGPPPTPENLEERSARLAPERAAASRARAASRKPWKAPAVRSRESGKAIFELLREPDGFAKVAALATLLPTLGPEAVLEVREVLESPVTDVAPVDAVLLVRFWASHDPEGASRWALMRAPYTYRAGVTLPAVELWARVDPQSALEAVQAAALLPGENLFAAQTGLVRGWLESDPQGLDDYLRGLGVGAERQRAMGVLARRTIQRDGPEAIMRWAESLPDDDEKYKLDAFRQVGSELAKLVPAAAASWCDTHCEGPYGNTVRMLVAQRWANTDGKAAMEWVATAPVGKERDWAARGAFRGWFRRDREGFNAWIGEIGPGGVEPWLQPVLEVYAIPLAAREPERAMMWAAAIEDDVDRERTFVESARVWRALDASAAEAWIEQSPLSDEARARVHSTKPLRRDADPSLSDALRGLRGP